MASSIEAISTIEAKIDVALADPDVIQSPELTKILTEAKRRLARPSDYGKTLRHFNGILARYPISHPGSQTPATVQQLATVLIRQQRGYETLLH